MQEALIAAAHAVAARGRARQPARLADPRRVATPDRPRARRGRAPPPRGARRQPGARPRSRSRSRADEAAGPSATTPSTCSSCAATRRCRRRRPSRSRCARSAASRPPRSRARSSCPRRRWRSGSAARSRPSRTSGVPLRGARAPARVRARLEAVMHVLYLVFSEGYAASAGPRLQRSDLVERGAAARAPAPRAGARGRRGRGPARAHAPDRRAPRRRAPARAASCPARRAGPALWDRDAIAEGVALVAAALPRGAVGPYQLQAAIAAVHDEAPSAAETRLAADPRRSTACCEACPTTRWSR